MPFTIIKVFLIIFEIVINMIIVLNIMVQCDNEQISITDSIKHLIEDLFNNRNIFGVILSCFALLTILPGFLIIFLLHLLLNFGNICKFIWNLGNTK